MTLTLVLFALLNSGMRLLLSLLLTVELIVYRPLLNGAERAGMGIVAGASLLTVPIVWDVEHWGTPFDGWAGFVLTIGCLIYFAGRATRHWRHKKANDAHAQMLERRGK